MEENFIRVDLDGNLFYKGSKLTHEKILEFFNELNYKKIDEKTFEFLWKIGDITQKIKVKVDDTLFVVKDVESKNIMLKVTLSNDSKCEINKDEIIYENEVPYFYLNDLKIMFNRKSAFKLGELLSES